MTHFIPIRVVELLAHAFVAEIRSGHVFGPSVYYRWSSKLTALA